MSLPDTVPRRQEGRWLAWVRRLTARLREVADQGLDLAFPPACLACEAPLTEPTDTIALCAACRECLIPAVSPACPRCGAFEPVRVRNGKCNACGGFRLWFDTVIPLGLYEGELRQRVLEMKHPSGDGMAAAAGRLLAATRGPVLAEMQPDAIVPVPMFWTRRWYRAANSPETIARVLAGALGRPVRKGWLRRQRATALMRDLGPRARFRNVRGAFGVSKDRQLTGLRILLVDDILTTGATCSEAARTLKSAGAAWVGVAVIARAQG